MGLTPASGLPRPRARTSGHASEGDSEVVVALGGGGGGGVGCFGVSRETKTPGILYTLQIKASFYVLIGGSRGC